MIRQLSGSISQTLNDAIVLDVQGVGYEVFVPQSTLRRQQVGSTGTWQIYTVVREDAFHLFGFESLGDREFFGLLLGVSGVGPKTALQVLNDGSAAAIRALQQSDVAFFQKIPRLGKKTAQKIIVELQSKVGGDAAKLFSPAVPLVRDLEEALLSMGYHLDQVQPILQTVDQELTLEAALKWALPQLRLKRI